MFEVPCHICKWVAKGETIEELFAEMANHAEETGDNIWRFKVDPKVKWVGTYGSNG